MKDGHLNKCKKCAKKDSNDHRANNLEKIRKYDYDRFHYDSGRRERCFENSRNYRKKYPDRYRAYGIVNNAVRSGKLIRLPCAICGDLNSHGHHEDYSKPLEVVWVCALHHHELDRKK